MQANKIFELTGTPFVDVGIVTLCRLSGKKKPEDLSFNDLVSASNRIVEIYLSEKWNKSLYSVFPNSLLTNPSSKKKGNIKQKYFEFLEDLIQNFNIDTVDKKICISCGRYNVYQPRLRMDIPMLGSGDLLNFFPAAQRGADYCNACTFAVQFFPVSMRSGTELFSIHSASICILRSWTIAPVQMINNDLALGSLTGPLLTKSNSPENALFDFSNEIILELEENECSEEISDSSVDLFQFSNFQQNAKLRIYSLPSKIFKFLFDIQHDYDFRSDWTTIVSRNYKRKKNNNEIDYNKQNALYKSLLDGRSIVHFFIDTSKKENLCGWKLVELYLERLENMEKERIEKIKEIADGIGDYFISGGYTKSFHNFENCKTYPEFRNQMRKILKGWISSSHEGVPFTFDDYVNYLIPEGIIDWKDTRDLLLFRIYEKMSSPELKERFTEMKEEIELEEEKND